MTTTIRSNGSKWAGQAPDSIDTLLGVLATATLDPTFERYGNFCDMEAEAWSFFGNFWHVSHVFNITTTDPDVAEALTAAIRANQQRPDYVEAKRVEAAWQAKRAAEEAKQDAERNAKGRAEAAYRRALVEGR